MEKTTLIPKEVADKINASFGSWGQQFVDIANEKINEKDNEAVRFAVIEMDAAKDSKALKKKLPDMVNSALVQLYKNIDNSLDGGKMLPNYVDWLLTKTVLPAFGSYISGLIVGYLEGSQK